MNANELKANLLAALGTTNEKNIFPRLKSCDMLETCGRCGGSGHYSYNAMTGTTCFGCNGAGLKMPKITAELVRKVANVWTAEYAAKYAADVKAAGESKRRVEAARGLYLKAKVHAEWKAAADAHFGKPVYWMTEHEYIEATRPELVARRTALHDLQKKIDKVLVNVNSINGKTYDRKTRQYVTTNWQQLDAELAPLLAEWEALNV